LGQNGKGGGEMKSIWGYLERLRLNLRKILKLGLVFHRIFGHAIEANFVAMHLNLFGDFGQNVAGNCGGRSILVDCDGWMMKLTS